MTRALLLACLLTCTIAPSGSAQVVVEGFLGGAVSAPSRVTMTQAGEPDLHFTAHWANRPFTPTWYYAIRIGLWNGRTGWQFDFTHHKVYQTDPPAEVERFQITNGVNMLTISRAWRIAARTRLSLGAGPTFGFPISTVRGKPYPHDNGILRGYHFAGGTLLGALTQEVPLVAGLQAVIDVRASASYLRVPIVDGHATLPVLAGHLHGGLGYRF